MSERGDVKEEVKWPVATGEKSDDTATHTANIMSSGRKRKPLTLQDNQRLAVSNLSWFYGLILKSTSHCKKMHKWKFRGR